MKIAMIGHKRIPGYEGGVEAVVEELSVRMVQAGHDITVYNRYHKGIKIMNSYKGVKIKTIPTINKKNLDAVIYSFFASIHTLFQKYDVIHYHAIGPSVMIFIPHFVGKRTVATVHGLNWKSDKWGKFAKWYMRLGERMISKYADEVIVLSRNMQDYFFQTYGRKTIYLPNGVELFPNLETKEIIQKFNLYREKYILFLGRIAPEKGVHYLIEAYNRIDTDLKLVIAGSSNGSFTENYFKTIETKCKNNSNIIFTGFVSGNLKNELYSNCALYVLPSDSEGMPIGLLEALSYGCKCVVSDIDENKEVIKEYGVMFQQSNIDDLAEKILNTLSMCHDPVTAKEYVSENFSWDKIAEEIMQIYEAK